MNLAYIKTAILLTILTILSACAQKQSGDSALSVNSDLEVKSATEWQDLPEWAKTPDNPKILDSSECINPLAIVNRANLLPVDQCEFTDLVDPISRGILSREGLLLRELVISDIQQLFADASKAGHPLALSSAWRDCAYQEKVFNSWVERGNGDENFANTYTYHCGASSHHLGTTIDILFAENEYELGVHMEETDTHEWLIKNVANYGCVKEYPKDKEEITGLQTEPWHYRCGIPIDAAKRIMTTELTLAEWLLEKHNQILLKR